MALAAVLPTAAAAEQASQPDAPEAAGLDVGRYQACALLPPPESLVRCWGYGGDGALGYANRTTIGDDETPAAAGPVNLGAEPTAKALSAGNVHSCAVRGDGDVLCWGFNGDGRLGYPGAGIIGDDEAPASAGSVALGTVQRATGVAAGLAHTCAVLEDGSVRCWGFGASGRLGYGNTANVGDDETPADAGPVPLGAGRTAKAVTAGNAHTCALLEDGNALCWGFGGNGELGYGNTFNIGDDETPADQPSPVSFGSGRTAVAISAGIFFTCAVLDDGTAKCWGYGGNGRLGTGSTGFVGSPFATAPIDLGAGRTAKAISAGSDHACAILDDGSVRCWGFGGNGRLGYGSLESIGDNETPGSVGPVDLGPGRTAVAISAGFSSTCARLDDGSLRCWGEGSFGRLGLCDSAAIGDDESPGSVGPVELGVAGSPGMACPVAPAPPGQPRDDPPPVPPPGPADPSQPTPAVPLAPSTPSPRRAPAQLRVERARVQRGRLQILIRITGRATGRVTVRFRAAGRTLSLTRRISGGTVRVSQRLSGRQARAGTGLLTVSYPGSSRVRSAAVRLRAARRQAGLVVRAARIASGELRASGTISRTARGVVRVRLAYSDAGGTLRFVTYAAPIRRGRWKVAHDLPDAAARAGGQLSILYPGSMRRRMAGAQTARPLSPAAP